LPGSRQLISVARSKNHLPTADWYAYPQYFEAAFADETPAEADFLPRAFARFAGGPVRRLLEPGCGGGRLVIEMARRGYDVTGLDNHPRMLAYLKRRIARFENSAGRVSSAGRGRSAERGVARVVAGDMTDFRFSPRFDSAFCTFNTFRHLTTEQAALDHLNAMARAIRPDGIYVLGFHLLPPDASEECIERWRARSGPTEISYTLRVLESCRRKRLERLRVTLLARTKRREVRAATEFDLRLYNAAQVRSLLEKVPEFELAAVYNFDYEIDRPLRLDNELSDAVFVLRRK
jgi:SAM-dependent methyltransferase